MNITLHYQSQQDAYLRKDYNRTHVRQLDKDGNFVDVPDEIHEDDVDNNVSDCERGRLACIATRQSMIDELERAAARLRTRTRDQ